MSNKLSKYQDYIIISLLAIITVLIYLPSLKAPFIFDDNHMIVNNLFIKNPHYFGEFFKGYVTSYPISKGMCRPLLMLTFALNYYAGGLNPISYHIINILFHFLNACLIYFLLKTLKKDASRGLLFLITLLFVVHPINTEAVTYISSRSDLMVTFFILGGFIFYLKKRYPEVILMYILALLTKETGLCLPIFIFGYYIIYENKRFFIRRNNKDITKMFHSPGGEGFLFVSILLVTLLYLYYKGAYFGGIHTGSTRSLFSNILIESWVAFFYLRLFLLPDNLNFLHINPDINSLLQPEAIFFGGIIILIVLMIALRKKKYLLSVGLFFYLTGLIPKFYATLKVPVAEHHFYLPSIGIYILLLAVLERIYLKNKRYFLYPTIGIILILATLTIERNHQLNYPFLVWKRGVEKEPQHIGNWLNLGVAYKDGGNLKEAKRIFEKALTVFNKDKDWQAGLYVNLAGVYLLEKNSNRSLEFLNKALDLNPARARICQIYDWLGEVYQIKGNIKQSIYFWKKAIKCNPYAWKIYQKLAKSFIERKKLTEGKSYLEEAIKINPYDFYSFFLLAEIFMRKENYEKAWYLYQKSIKLKPDWFYSHYGLARLYIKLKDPLCLKELAETIRLNPHFKPALYLLKKLSRHSKEK